MYDAGKVLTGIVIFAVLVTFPFFLSAGKAGPKPDPKLDTPAIQALGAEKQCVESKAFMKANHMQLLNDWRDNAVREGHRQYVGLGGKKYDISLQNTCMKCHSNKTKFCDECHNYMAVKPYCWDCHVAPKEKKA